MPRHRRIDISGAVHHVITRGLDGKDIFRDGTCIEDIDFRQPRGLDKSLIARLAGLPVDKESPKSDHYRANRHRQILFGLCLCPEGLPRRLFRRLSANIETLRRPEFGKGKWQIYQNAHRFCQNRSAGAGRLRTFQAQPGTAT